MLRFQQISHLTNPENPEKVFKTNRIMDRFQIFILKYFFTVFHVTFIVNVYGSRKDFISELLCFKGNTFLYKTLVFQEVSSQRLNNIRGHLVISIAEPL